jgi:hypothetical protein
MCRFTTGGIYRARIRSNGTPKSRNHRKWLIVSADGATICGLVHYPLERVDQVVHLQAIACQEIPREPNSGPSNRSRGLKVSRRFGKRS